MFLHGELTCLPFGLSVCLCVCLSPVCLPVPKVMEVEMWASGSVLRQGEVLTINCTVKDTEMVYFTWDFPRKQVLVFLSVLLSVSLYVYLSVCLSGESFVIISLFSEVKHEFSSSVGPGH